MSQRGCLVILSEPARREPLHEDDLARGYVIGRGPEADLRLDDPLVSRRHCRLFLRDDEVYVEDLGGRNGTRCGGRKVTQPIRLHHGDRLVLGPVEVGVELGGEPIAAPPANVHEADTMRLPTDRSLDVQAPVPGAAWVGPDQAAGPDEALVLTLDDRAFTVGRDLTCRFAVEDLIVSRAHARIELTADGYVVADLGSTNGTFVNGLRLTEPQALRVGDVLSFGPYHLTFDGRRLVSRRPRLGGARIEVQGLTREVRDRRTRKPLRLLEDVSLVILRGQFVGLLGASGCGKSTLMDAINGRRPATRGRVLYDGQSLYDRFEAFKGGIGYVPQQLIFHEDLPLRSALRYTSRLRLSRDSSRAEIEANIDRVLETVGLAESSHTLIRDLSGGQKKRVSIAMELLSQPQILFLDEVTSGLDLGTEQQMMQLFRRLADRGMTVVCISHYVESLDVCDTVTYLVRGRLGFYGPPEEFKSYFGIGAIREIYAREGDCTPEQWRDRFRRSEQYRQYVERLAAPYEPSGREPAGAPGAPKARTSTRPDASQPPGPDRWRWSDFWRQLCVCGRRYVHVLTIDRRNLLVLLGLAPVVAFMICLVCASLPVRRAPDEVAQWRAVKEQFEARLAQKRRDLAEARKFRETVMAGPSAGELPKLGPGRRIAGRLDKEIVKGHAEIALGEKLAEDMNEALNQAELARDLQDGRNQSLICFTTMLTVMFLGLFGAVREIVKDDAIYRHERFVNLQILPYLLSKLLPLAAVGAVQTAGVLIIVNTWTGVRAGGFGEQFVVMFAMSLAGTTMGLAISSAVPNSDWAVLTMIAVVIPQMLFAGALLPVRAVAGFVSRYFMVSFWGFQSIRSLFDPAVRAALAQHTGRPDYPCFLGVLIILGHVLVYGLAAIVLLARKDGRGGVLRMFRSAVRVPLGLRPPARNRTR